MFLQMCKCWCTVSCVQFFHEYGCTVVRQCKVYLKHSHCVWCVCLMCFLVHHVDVSCLMQQTISTAVLCKRLFTYSWFQSHSVLVVQCYGFNIVNILIAFVQMVCVAYGYLPTSVYRTFTFIVQCLSFNSTVNIGIVWCYLCSMIYCCNIVCSHSAYHVFRVGASQTRGTSFYSGYTA